MNKLIYYLTQLLNELTTFETHMNGKKGETNVFMAQDTIIKIGWH